MVYQSSSSILIAPSGAWGHMVYQYTWANEQQWNDVLKYVGLHTALKLAVNY